MLDFDCPTAPHNPFFDLGISPLIGEGNRDLMMDASFPDVANTSPRGQVQNRKESTTANCMHLFHSRLTFGEDVVQNPLPVTPGPECADMLTQSGGTLSQSGDRASSDGTNKNKEVYSIEISEEEGAHL